MRYAVAFVVFLTGIVAHWWWGTYFTLWGLAPQLLLVLTVAIASVSGPVAGQCYGFAWGLFLDAAGVHLFGSNALSLTVAAYLVGGAKRQMDVSSPISQAMVTAAATVGTILLLAVLGFVFERRAFWPGWGNAVLVPLFNGFLGPVVFPLVNRAVRDL